MWYCYVIKNLINGKLYVGKSGNVKKRWSEHKRLSRGEKKYRGQQQVIHKAMNKYGIENFAIDIVGSYETEDKAFNNEKEYIIQLKIDGYTLYNQTNGGEGASGRKSSKESIEKTRRFNLGRCNTDETKRIMSLAHIGKKLTEATKQKISLSNLGRKHSDETKNKISLANKNKIHSEQWNKNVSISSLGKHITESSKEKNRQSHLGKIHSEETKQKISKSHLGKRRSKIHNQNLSGERSGKSKLNWDKVNKIRELFFEGTAQNKLAILFNVNAHTIWCICHYKTWKNQPDK